MSKCSFARSLGFSRCPLFAVGLVCAVVAGACVLDDFDDNTKTGWRDFTLIPGVGQNAETDGHFKFTLPPAGQDTFLASAKTGWTFGLGEGQTIEFRVDLVSGNGKDAFAVLALKPLSAPEETLDGYALVKSSTDIRITKGINKCFVDEAVSLKNQNVTLVLRMTHKSGAVHLTGAVLDKSSNAVLWRKTVIDTRDADAMASGSDEPAAPYTGPANPVLGCHEDFDPAAPQESYEAIFDNAEVFVLEDALLDNFDDNVKTNWKDFNFPDSFPKDWGLPQEVAGTYLFTGLFDAFGSFSASTKTSRQFQIADGEQLEFRVDIVSGNGPDSFGAVGFLPTNSPVYFMEGYTLAKSSTDIRLVKRIYPGEHDFFVSETSPLKNTNVTLVLNMLCRGSSVFVTGTVLDKENNNAVLWQKTVVDTPNADTLASGVDRPAAAWIGTGRYVLYFWQDSYPDEPQTWYVVDFDNAEACAPPAVVVESSPRIGAELSPDASATIDAAARTITLPRPNDTRFYRVAGARVVSITSVVLEGGTLVLKYE